MRGSFIIRWCFNAPAFRFEMVSKVEQALVCGWLLNINPVCCCFSLMFSDSLARSDLFVWVPEENSKTNRGQICTAPHRSFPPLCYFQHLRVTMASAAQTQSESALSDFTFELALISECLAQCRVPH